MSEFDATIGVLPGAPLPALGTDFAIVSRDGVRLNQIQLRNWPLSNPVAGAIATRLGPTDLATINGQSLIQPGGNIVIATGGTATWGGITGTLSGQTDLQAALDARPLTSSLGSAAFTASSAYATAAQGAKADSAAQLNVTQGYTASQYSVPLALAYAATVTPNLTLRDNFTLTLTGNVTLANPSAKNVGQSGAIVITQDATGSRLISYGSEWVAEGGAQALSTAANAVDVLYYFVVSSTKIDYRLRKAA